MSQTIAQNKKAFFNFSISDTYEAGICLKGAEVKSIRAGKISLNNSYIIIKKQEAWLIDCHINPFPLALHQPPDPNRNRKLLLNKREIKQLSAKIEQKGFSILPLKIFFKNQRVKIQIGLGKAKKLHDKRENLKQKAQDLEIKRSIKHG